MIPQHERLFRSMYFGDDDYAYCVAEVLQTLVSYRPNNLEALERYIAEAHGNALRTDADIIPTEEKNCPCQLFISHKAEEKGFASALKGALTPYGIESFVAHQDIQVTLEWEREIERVLKSVTLSSILHHRHRIAAHGASKRLGGHSVEIYR